MSYVFVLDTNKQPLNPVHPGWARKLLSSGRAAVYKRYPFTIILKVAVLDANNQPLMYFCQVSTFENPAMMRT